MRSLRPTLALLLLAPLAATGQTQPKPARVPLGKFTLSWVGGRATIELKDRKRPYYEVSSPAISLRSQGIDLDARRIEARDDRSKKEQRPITGEMEGAVKIVLRSAPGSSDTLTCARATFTFDGVTGAGKVTIPGAVRLVRTGPEYEEPLVVDTDSGSVTLRDKGQGPLIELGSGSATGTPREKPAEKKKNP